MKVAHQNPIANLSELELNVSDQRDFSRETELFAELRFSTDDIYVDSLRIEVGVARAILSLELWGSDIKPGTRLNDGRNTDIQTTVELVTEAEQNLQAGGSASISGLNPTGVSAAISASGNSGRMRRETTTAKSQVQRVRARAGQRWQIEEADISSGQSFLNDTFIQNERLCVVTRKPDSNMVEVIGKIVVRKQDLAVRPDGMQVQRDFRKLVHKEKIIKALIGKSVSRALGQEDLAYREGLIVISQSSITDSDDERH